MLGNPYFGFNLIKKYISLFGTLFNDIYVDRPTASGGVQNIKIPIEYSPKDKMLARVEADPKIDRKFALLTPSMGFEYTDLKYYPTTKLPNTVKTNIYVGNNAVNSQYTPVPYSLYFKLYIIVKNADDGTKIVEQILPFFTPDWTLKVELIPELNEIKDIPVILNGIEVEDNYSDNYAERRNIVWTLSFEMKVWFYKPVINSGLIRFVNVNFYNAISNNIADAIGNTAIAETVEVQPVYGNTNVLDIQPTDPYTYSVSITDTIQDNIPFLANTEFIIDYSNSYNSGYIVIMQ